MKSGPSVADALDSLVSQFSSALDCYRELIQNAIDAGSPRVDVWMEYTPSEGASGTIAIHVDDFGEGMDETIIDGELTQLFASGKENDLTKIGKFGIGFVSVFALQPRAVLIHTGRGGQYWEILFHEDRSFSKAPIDVPTEGTQITLFIAGDRHRYTELVDATIATLRRWCRHSETEVTFEDRSDPAATPLVINEPFAVDGDLMTTVRHQGTEIAIAYDRRPSYGFFNRGLTLLETSDPEEALGSKASRFSHIAFRIKSRYLEHTLSRETIMRDHNYDKAVGLLDRAAAGPLRTSLVDALTDDAAGSFSDIARTEDYLRRLAFLCEEPDSCLGDIDDRPILRTVYGDTISLAEVYRASEQDGRVFVTAEASETTDALRTQGVPIIWGRLGGGRQAIASRLADRSADAHLYEPVRAVILRYLVYRDRRSLLGRVERMIGINLRADVRKVSEYHADPYERLAGVIAEPHVTYIALRIVEHPTAEETSLLRRAHDALRETGAGYKDLALFELTAPEGDAPLFVIGRSYAPLMSRAPSVLPARDGPRRPVAAVNRDHPVFRELVGASQRRPALAAYFLAKRLLLQRDHLLERDGELMRAAQAGQ